MMPAWSWMPAIGGVGIDSTPLTGSAKMGRWHPPKSFIGFRYSVLRLQSHQIETNPKRQFHFFKDKKPRPLFLTPKLFEFLPSETQHLHTETARRDSGQ